MSRHISTLNYLRSADTCLTRTRTVIYWLSAPAITDSVNIMQRFRRSFQANSLAHTRSIVSVLPSGDHKQCFISRVYACEMNHVITASKVFYFQPAMSKKTILSFDKWMEALRWLDGVHRVESVDSIECLWSSCQLVRKNANSMYRSRQSCHRGRLKFGRPAASFFPGYA